MKKVIYQSVAAFIIVFLNSCSPYDGIDAETQGLKRLNPNGDSELAINMRSMYDHLVNARTEVLNNMRPDNLPAEFLRIKTAVPSTDNIKGEKFDEFADLYITSLYSFYNSESQNLRSNFNILVTSCITCHQQNCPGPLVKFDRLLIK